MKNLLPIFIFLIIGTLSTSAQHEIEFTFANAQNTNDGADDFYEVDVLISTTGAGIDFKLGSGLLYFNYNTAAFGTNVAAGGNVEYSYPNGSYILGEHEKDFNFGDLYNQYIVNDNTSSRVAFSWQQNYASGVFAGNNVTNTAAELFHMKIKYVDVGQDPGVSFENLALFIDQTFTACGSFGSIPPLTSADCFNDPGTQITNDNYDSSGAALGGGLPVEWLFFNADKNVDNVDLVWATAAEINTSHFEIERSGDGQDWKNLTTISAAGNANQQQNYKWKDIAPLSKQNYYRIQQVDLDDKFEYSEIETVFMESFQQDISIFPNPTKESFTITFEKETDTVLRLFNSTGVLVLQQNISERTTSIPTHSFPSGIYYVNVIQQGKPIVHRLTLLE